LPLFSIAIGVVVLQWPRSAIALFTALAGLNLWFLSVSGWYHQDFALFRKQDAADYRRDGGPAALIQRLNREAPGQPVAFFSSEAVAGLHGDAYTDSWHHSPYWTQIRAARNTADVAATLRRYQIRHIIAPASLKGDYPLMDAFLHEWLVPDGAADGGPLALFRLRELPPAITSETPTAPLSDPKITAAPVAAPPPVRHLSGPLPAGSWDDLDERIVYQGAWLHDRQFPESLHQSLSYSTVPGDALHFTFTGTGITYVFTEALNRGTALVLIDGREVARIDEYSPQTKWKQSRDFDGLEAGTHTFEIRVLDTKDPRSSGTFVDLDGIVVR
jgi:hypothetical protein